jgi:hypothetical protein
MSITISATFTKNGGAAASGLTLAEISLYLYAENKITGAVTTIWNGTQNPTAEVGALGVYIRPYAAGDLDTYNYYAAADYGGATVLDRAFITGTTGATLTATEIDVELSAAHGAGLWGETGTGAITWAYTLTNAIDGSPVADADIGVTSDAAGANRLASGRTSQFGVVTFYLDAGTVYVWRQKTGWNFTNPDTEVVA